MGGKWGRRGREVGEKGEGSGGKGGGNWEWGTPLSTPSVMPFSVFANKAYPSQTAALSGSTLFAYGKIIALILY